MPPTAHEEQLAIVCRHRGCNLNIGEPYVAYGRYRKDKLNKHEQRARHVVERCAQGEGDCPGCSEVLRRKIKKAFDTKLKAAKTIEQLEQLQTRNGGRFGSQ